MAHAKFHDLELDEEATGIAKRSLGETPESRSKGFQILKNKLLDFDDLHPRLDEAFLLRFLRVSKFDASRAFQRVCSYYSVQRKYPHIFDRFYPSAASSVLYAGHFLASPKRMDDHSVLIVHKRGLFVPSEMVFEEMSLLDTLILDYLVDNPVTQLCGITIILDFQGYSFQTFRQDTPRRVRMAIDVFQNFFPLRLRSIHVVNAPQIFSLIYNLGYPLLTQKMRNRFHIHHSDWKSLHNLVPRDILPEAYGGALCNQDMIDLSREVAKREEFFKDQHRFGFTKKKPSLRH